MAIARDASSGSNDGSGSATSLTWSHTNTGSNLILIVGGFLDNKTTDTITSVTYNTVGLTKITGVSDGGNGGYSTLWYLINPATGAHNIVISYTGANNVSGTAISYTGASQSGQPDSSNTGGGTGSGLTLSSTVVGSNCWLVSICTSLNDSLSAGTGTTDVVTDNRGVLHMGDTNTTVGTGSQSMGWNVGTNNGGVIASVAPVASGPANLKTYNTNVKSNIKTIDTNVIANVKSLNTNV